MKKIFILFMLPWILHPSNDEPSRLSIREKAIALRGFSLNDNPAEYNTYLSLLGETRKEAKDYVSQIGSARKLHSRKQLLTKFNIAWNQYELRLFSDNDINIWAKNWIFETQV